MRWYYKLPLRRRSLFRKNKAELDLREELQFHLQNQIDEFVAQGMHPQEARRAASKFLGGVEQVKEECRDARQVNFIDNFLHDVRFSLRLLRKSPGFTAVAILTLSFGIGATSAIFGVVDAVLLRPLPYPEAGRLVMIWEVGKAPGKAPETLSVSWQDYQDWRTQVRSLEPTRSSNFFRRTRLGRYQRSQGSVGEHFSTSAISSTSLSTSMFRRIGAT